MKYIKHKLLIFTLAFVGIFGYMSVVQVPAVFAGSLTYNIACNDGSSKLAITKNDSKHEVTVKCKSGAKFDYLAGDNATVLAVGKCPDPQQPATKVDKPNEKTSELIFYCVRVSGSGDNANPVRTNTTPTVNEKAPSSNNDDEDSSNVGSEYDEDDCTRGLNGSCELVDMIVTITNVLSGLAGVVIVAMIIWGGIQYSMAGADPSKVQAAKQKIINALLALLLLVFGFSIIQWLVPGGLI